MYLLTVFTHSYPELPTSRSSNFSKPILCHKFTTHIHHSSYPCWWPTLPSFQRLLCWGVSFKRARTTQPTIRSVWPWSTSMTSYYYTVSITHCRWSNSSARRLSHSICHTQRSLTQQMHSDTPHNHPHDVLTSNYFTVLLSITYALIFFRLPTHAFWKLSSQALNFSSFFLTYRSSAPPFSIFTIFLPGWVNLKPSFVFIFKSALFLNHGVPLNDHIFTIRHKVDDTALKCKLALLPFRSHPHSSAVFVVASTSLLSSAHPKCAASVPNRHEPASTQRVFLQICHLFLWFTIHHRLLHLKPILCHSCLCLRPAWNFDFLGRPSSE